jgi:FkbM family methyltransferase
MTVHSAAASVMRLAPFPGRYRLCYALMAAFGRPQGIHEVPMRFGGKVRVNAATEPELFYCGDLDFNVDWFIARNVKHDSVILDIGARVGENTVSMAAQMTRFGDGIIHAIEALPANFDLLKENLRLNVDCCKVHPHNLAVGESTGFFDAPAMQHSGNYSLAQKSESTIKIPKISLDDFARQFQIGHIDLIVMDIEGAETMALRGAKQLLSEKRIRKMLVEINPIWLERMGTSAAELWDTTLGMNCYLLTTRLGRLKPLRRESYLSIAARCKRNREKFDVVFTA